MPNRQSVPEATAYRLSLYHCFLGEVLRAEHEGEITSRELAERLDLSQETVRRDISFLGSVGRPGAGYNPRELHRAIQSFLGLSDQYPVIRIGSAEMLRALQTVFPAETWGVKPVAYYSEEPTDVGSMIEDIPVKHVTDIPDLDRELNVRVALVACSPNWVQIVIDLCAKAGIEGVLLLTPALSVIAPEGVKLSQIRMPCDIKSLACHCSPVPQELISES